MKITDKLNIVGRGTVLVCRREEGDVFEIGQGVVHEGDIYEVVSIETYVKPMWPNPLPGDNVRRNWLTCCDHCRKKSWTRYPP
jgi:hypothetical protein